jgi:3',5'-cyclic AMP phosphodiesterase CpdA
MKKLTISRREAIQSLAVLTAGACLKPLSVLAADPVQNTVRFAVIGDWGTDSSDTAGIANQMFSSHRQTPFNFVVAAGDNIYPNGDGKYLPTHFERPFAKLLSDRVPFHAVLGNHDVEHGRQDQCQYPLFNMGGTNYYSIKQGGGLVELFMLDSTDFDVPQMAWLERALSASSARWKIAVLHHPLYSSGNKHGSDLQLRKQLEPIFMKHRVSAVFSGHDHIYERTKLQKGIQYFVTGAGGKTRRGGVDLRSPFREVSYDKDNHFMVVEVSPQRLSFQAISEAGQIVDSSRISLTT